MWLISKSTVFFGVLLTLVVLSATTRVSYEGHKVFKVYVETQAQAKTLKDLEDVHGILIDFWMPLRKLPGHVHVRLDPEHQDKVLDILTKAQMKYEIMIDNLQSLIDAENIRLNNRTIFKAGDHPSLMTINEYHTYDEISAYLDSVAAEYSTTSVGSVGKSYEGRDMKYIRIGTTNTPKKQAHFVNACQHGREWLSCATAVYTIYYLTSRCLGDQKEIYKDDCDIFYLNDVYIMPIVNPDGYVYSWNKDRNWRKTRSGPRQGCYGVDPNRNWNFKWGVAGSSSNPCSQTYDGPSPESEYEVRNLAKFLNDKKNIILSYYDLGTYGELWTFPYGYAEVYPPEVTWHRTASQCGAQIAHDENGENFAYGSITDVLYPMSGNSADYATGVLKTDLSFHVLLRPSGDDFNGFVVPEDQIVLGAQEFKEGFTAIICEWFTDDKHYCTYVDKETLCSGLAKKTSFYHRPDVVKDNE